MQFKDLTKCEFFDDYLFKMGVLITVRKGKREELNEFFKTCSQQLSFQMKAMLYFPFLGDVKEVGDYLKSNGIALKQRLKIQSAFGEKKKVRKLKEEIMELLEAWQKEDVLKSPEERQKGLKRLERLNHKYFKKLFTFVLAIKSKNIPWAVSLKRELIKFSPYWNLTRGLDFNEEEDQKLRDFLLFSLELFKDFHKEDEGVKMLAEKFAQMGHSNEYKTIKSRNGADWSLTDLRNQFKNPFLKSEFFDFWYLMMMNRTSDAELREKFRQAISVRSLIKAKPGQMWVFEYFYPPQQILRKIILDKLEKMWASNAHDQRYVVLRTLDSASVKQSLAERDSNFKRASFQLKREFFSDVLSTGFSTENALYELYLLGDKNEENLWWLMI